jgi:hypothetical protein
MMIDFSDKVKHPVRKIDDLLMNYDYMRFFPVLKFVLYGPVQHNNSNLRILPCF